MTRFGVVEDLTWTYFNVGCTPFNVISLYGLRLLGSSRLGVCTTANVPGNYHELDIYLSVYPLYPSAANN